MTRAPDDVTERITTIPQETAQATDAIQQEIGSVLERQSALAAQLSTPAR